MKELREVCLFLTLNCNQNCRYCHRFLNIDGLDFESNKKIIDKISKDGIKKLTFTGGEPFLYPNILELAKIAKEKGLQTKIITNGVVLANNPNIREIYNYLDSITLSIDSVDSNINEKLGRGENHFINIRKVLDSLKYKKLNVNINTVVSRVNLSHLEELGKFLKDYNINTWRIFKFMPLRERALLNKDEFEISNSEFRINRPLFINSPHIKKIEFREDDDMEEKYVLIMPNGDVKLTENKVDVTIGNILENSISELIASRKQNKKYHTIDKIRTLIAYNDENERKSILQKVNELNYVEVVGVAASGVDTFNKIVDLNPEIVFTKYDLNDLDGLELVKKTKQELSTKMPVFNFISDDLQMEQLKQVVDIAENKVNVIIKENQKEDTIVKTLQDYKKFRAGN